MADVDDSAPRRRNGLWELHAADLVRYATVLVGPIDAQDVASIAFIKMAVAPTNGLDNPRAYLFRIATNVAFDQMRSAKRRQRRDLLAPTNGRRCEPIRRRHRPPTPPRSAHHPTLQKQIRHGRASSTR